MGEAAGCSIVGSIDANVDRNYDYNNVLYAVPSGPVVILNSTTATTITISWSVPSGSVVDSYIIQWVRNTSVGCPDADQGSVNMTDGGSTSYVVSGLEEDSSYTITVTACSVTGKLRGEAITGMTKVAGESSEV